MSFYVDAHTAKSAGVANDLVSYLEAEGVGRDVAGIHVITRTSFVLVVWLRNEAGEFYTDPSNPTEVASAIRPISPTFVMPADLYDRMAAIGEPSLIRAA